MKKSYLVIILVLVVLAVGAGFYYRETIFKAYNVISKNVTQDVQNFQKTDLGNTVNQLAQKIMAPAPLMIGGNENSTVLTKAKVISWTNVQRHDNGALPALIENQKLDAAALAKANDLFKNQYFEHVSPSGVDPGTLVKSYGYNYIISGENLILGNFTSEQQVVQDWMNSPGHRANILNTRFVDIGVAMVKGTYKGETVWVGVQEFGLPISVCPAISTSLKAKIDAERASLDTLSSQITAKKAEIDNTDQNDPHYNELIGQYNNLVDQYNQLANQTKSDIAEYNGQINVFNNCVAGK